MLLPQLFILFVVNTISHYFCYTKFITLIHFFYSFYLYCKDVKQMNYLLLLLQIISEFSLWNCIGNHKWKKVLRHTSLKFMLRGSNTMQRCCLWKKCLKSRRQWNLSSGSVSLSLFKTSSSFKPVLCLNKVESFKDMDWSKLYYTFISI